MDTIELLLQSGIISGITGGVIEALSPVIPKDKRQYASWGVGIIVGILTGLYFELSLSASAVLGLWGAFGANIGHDKFKELYNTFKVIKSKKNA